LGNERGRKREREREREREGERERVGEREAKLAHHGTGESFSEC
jgi:hypothetical protein